MSTLAWVLLCCSWLIVVHADTDFLSPPQSGLNITHDCSYVIKWSSSWGAGSLVSLVLWQYTGVEWDPQWLFSEIPDPGDYTWSATTVKGNPVSEMMHFELCLGPCANESTQAAIDSGRVYVDGDGATCPGGSGSTTSSTSTTSSISTTPAVLTPSSAAEVFTSSTSPTATSTPSATSSSKGDNLGPATDVSTIVGTVVGVCGFIVAVVTLWLAWRANKRKDGKGFLTEKLKAMQRS